jgi:Family of unknown function (DUF6221)
VNDLTTWLLEQIARVKQMARDCGGAPWVAEVGTCVHVDAAAICEEKWKLGHLGYVGSIERDTDREHVVEWDPARVLADCEAKEEILHALDEIEENSLTHEAGWAGSRNIRRLLALSYSHCPGYLQEWAP